MDTCKLLLEIVKEKGIVKIIIQYKKDFEEIDLIESEIIKFIDGLILEVLTL